jgi:hypothetical protein
MLQTYNAGVLDRVSSSRSTSLAADEPNKVINSLLHRCSTQSKQPRLEEISLFDGPGPVDQGQLVRAERVCEEGKIRRREIFFQVLCKAQHHTFFSFPIP